jgi:hypothetical protein
VRKEGKREGKVRRKVVLIGRRHREALSERVSDGASESERVRASERLRELSDCVIERGSVVGAWQQSIMRALGCLFGESSHAASEQWDAEAVHRRLMQGVGARCGV